MCLVSTSYFLISKEKPQNFSNQLGTDGNFELYYKRHISYMPWQKLKGYFINSARVLATYKLHVYYSYVQYTTHIARQ